MLNKNKMEKEILKENRRMLELAGIITEGFDFEPEEETENLDEMSPDQVAGVAGAATGVGLTIAAVLSTVVSKYKEIKKSKPEQATADTIKQALTATLQSLTNQHSTRY